MATVIAIFAVLAQSVFYPLTALAGSTAWAFASGPDYTYNATNVEVTSSTARLKSQQYTGAEANTAANWNFDETSGNSANDGGSNNNDLTYSTTTPCAAATWSAGKVVTVGTDRTQYGATTLAGNAGCVTAADSPSLSLNSQATLEAYAKFTGAFDATNTVTQGVLDKGNYRMYFDEGDGKLKFEMDDSAAKTWNKVGGSSLTPTTPGINGNDGLNGSWRQAIPHTIFAIQEFNSELYVGTYGTGTDLGTGEVWKYSGSNQTWTKVGGDGNGSTNWDTKSTEGVFSLAVHSGALYAGLGLGAGDAEVWRYSGSGTTWTKVAGGGVNGGWTTANAIEFVASLVSDGTYLYAGTGSTSASFAASDADVWRCTNCGTTPSWTQIGGTSAAGANVNTSWGTWVATTNAFESVRSMVVMGGNLYVGLGDTANGTTYADAEVWRWNGSAWAIVGGDGVGWILNTSEMVFSLATDGTTLYAGLGSSASDADVWACAACGTIPVWTQIGGNEVHATKPNWNTNYENVRGLVVLNSKLYAGIGDSAGEAEVWRYDTTSWTKVAGDGANSTWDASFTTPASTTNTKEYAFLGTFGTSLVAGTGATPQDAEVWTCASCDTAPSWSWVGGRDFRSWGSYQPSYVTSMAVNAGNLYVGTGTTNKHAAIWEYNGSAWTQVGGGNLNIASGSWENYEYVLSMTSYKGDLYSGFGSTADDADVWKYSAGAWTQVGGTTAAGATVNNGWTDANNIEEVVSMVADDTYLYAGTGNTATDGDVWRFDGTTWGTNPIGGTRNDTNVMVNSSWATNTYERVQSMKIANGLLFAGLGSSAGDAEVWRWNGTTWGGATIGGDGVGSGASWNAAGDVVRESVRTMTFIGSVMYVGLGDTNDGGANADAEVWSCSNCMTIGATPAWTKIGGDGVGWDNSTYEQVTSISSFKGRLFATLGTNNSGTDYDSEIWEYDGSTWSKVGGDGATADTWGGNYEIAGELITLNGKLYVGLGTTNNNGAASDAEVWEYGANTVHVLASTTSSWTAGRWYHIAGTYDGTTAKVYVCDSTTLSNCDTAQTTATWGTVTLADSTLPLSVGSLWGSLGPDRSLGGFAGQLDEVRVMNTAQTSFTLTQFAPTGQTVQNAVATPRTQKYGWSGFSTSETGNGGAVAYRLSSDNGSTWKYYTAGAWTTSGAVTDASSASTVNTNISTFPMSSSGLVWQAVLTGDGDQQVTLSNVTVSYVDDTTAPNNVTNVTGNASSGSWFDRTNPSFSWSAPTDDLPNPNPGSELASGIKGYWVYFGTNAAAVPSSVGSFQVGTSYTASAISSADTQAYYFRIQAQDNALNLSATYDKFHDTQVPNNVTTVTGNDSSGNWFDRANPSFSWSAPTDDLPSPNPSSEVASGVNGYYVYFGTSASAVPRTVGVFQTGTTFTASPISSGDSQTYYLRIQTQDKALNTTSDSTGVLDAFRDTKVPNNVTAVTGNESSGSWFDRANPQFSWTAPTDDLPSPNPSNEKASGVKGYWVYFGTSADAVPRTQGTFITTTSYAATPISAADTQAYFFRIQTKDKALNTTDDSTGVFDAFRDTTAPNNVTSVTALSASGGSAITTNTWYNHSSPEFSWSAPTDDLPSPNSSNELASGVSGYYVYFGPDSNAVPRSTGTFQTGRTFVPSNLTSGLTYHLRIQTRDRAYNTTSDVSGILGAFSYKIDTAGPTGPTVSVSPAGYTAVNSFTFFWLNSGSGGPVDSGYPTTGSGFSGNFIYRVGSADWSLATLETQITIPSAAYQEGANVFEIKAIDNVGNLGPTSSVTFYYSGLAPTPPSNLTVTPITTAAAPSATNAFKFTWGPPEASTSPVKQYRFSVNKVPTSTNTTATPFATLAEAPYATQQGKNTFYVVAEDEAGNVNYDNPASVDFYALTPAPSAPTSLQAFDISNRDTGEYAISMKWSEPTKGSGFDGYEVFRSDDNVLFTSAGTTKSPVFIDTNLESKMYYFKAKSRDNAGQSSVDSSTVTIVPTGRYTSPPTLTDAPAATVKSFSASVTWQTDRIASSFIEYGVDRYHLGKQQGGETVGTLDLTLKHTVALPGLEPETTYAYQAVWVDQDGNQGRSDILSFQTGLRPKISNVEMSNISLATATVSWTSTTISDSTVKYGTTRSFGSEVTDKSGSGTTKHTVQLANLSDSTTYYFQIVGQDVDNNTLTSDEYSFATLIRPIISDVTYEPVKDAPSTSLRFAWKTNVPTTSIIQFGPAGGKPITNSSPEYQTDHTLVAGSLGDNSAYTFQVRGVDSFGNTATSDTYRLTTPDDSRAPKVLNLNIEVRSSGVGQDQKAQLVVSWETDEPSTSQVEFGPGISSDSYPSKTQEDAVLTASHVVIVPELEPAKIYHLRAVSRDRAQNAGISSDTTAITGKTQRSVIDIIINSLQRSLGFLVNFGGLGK